VSRLYGRRIDVVVGDLRVEDLRCAFQVKKPGSSKPNTAELRISNLQPDTRARLTEAGKGAPLIIQAGYPGTLGTIFSGEIRTVDHIRKGVDWETTIKSGDGERAYAFATIAEGFRAGTPARVVVSRLIESLGLDPGRSQQVLAELNAAYVHGYSANGRSADYLDEILNGLGYQWSIQDGRVEVVKQGQTTLEEVVFLSPETGLLDSPEHGAGDEPVEGNALIKKFSVVKLKALIQPRIKPHCRISVESEGLKGILRVLALEHAGDTGGGEGSWATTIQSLPV
jgi:hypothetical protein